MAARPVRVGSTFLLAGVALAGFAGCQPPCDSGVTAAGFEGSAGMHYLDVGWRNAWMGPPQKASCWLEREAVEIVAFEGIKVTWEPPSPDDDRFFETSLNDGVEWGLEVPVVNGDALVEVMGSTAAGDEYVLGTSKPVSTWGSPTCLVEGPNTSAWLAPGTNLRVPLRGCDGDRYDAYVASQSGERVGADVNLLDGSVDVVLANEGVVWIELEPKSTAPVGTSTVKGPRFVIARAGSGTCGPVSVPTPSDPGRGIVEGAVVRSVVGDPVQCWYLVYDDDPSIGLFLRRLTAPRDRVRVVVDGTILDQPRFTVPLVEPGYWVLSFDQGVASIDSDPFVIGDPVAPPCLLERPRETETLYVGEPQRVPITNAGVCDLPAIAADGAWLTVGFPDLAEVEEFQVAALSGLANGEIAFTIPTTLPFGSDYGQLDLRSGLFRQLSPHFEVAFRPCGLPAPAAGRLAIGSPASIPIEYGDRCIADRLYDGAWLRSVNDPTGFTALELDPATDLADGRIDFEVPVVPTGTYTIGLGTVTTDAVTSPAFQIVAPGTGGGGSCQIFVDAPAAGAKVDAGDPIDVAWWSDCDEPMDILLWDSLFSTDPPLLVAEDETDDGEATITIPEDTAPGADYRLCVRTADGGSSKCSAPFEVLSGCEPSSTLAFTPTSGGAPTQLPYVTATWDAVDGLIDLEFYEQPEGGSPLWRGSVYGNGLADDQALTQATGSPTPDAVGESTWGVDDGTPPSEATSTSVGGTVTTWVPGVKLEVTDLTAEIDSGPPPITGTLAGSFTACIAPGA